MSQGRIRSLRELDRAVDVRDRHFDVRSRVKFTISKTDLLSRINELKNASALLRDLHRYSTELKEHDNKRSAGDSGRLAFHLQQVQTHACSLFDAVVHGFSSQCHTRHVVRLFLEARSAALHQEPARIGYKIAISAMPVAPKAAPSGGLVNVELLNPVKPIDPCENLKRQTNVGPPYRVAVIENLCRYLVENFGNDKDFKTYLSPEGFLLVNRSLASPSPMYSSNRFQQNSITVKEILDRSANCDTSHRPWTLRQRMSLSLTLTSSLLQLCSTSWLSAFLSKERICFFRTRASPNEGFVIDADHPFITYRKEASDPSPRDCHVKRQLLELGILLLELWHDISFESWAAETNSVPGSSYGTRYESVVSWLRRSAEDILPSYHDVVLRCIECAFPTEWSYQNWQDQTLRKAICEEVIRPLHRLVDVKTEPVYRQLIYRRDEEETFDSKQNNEIISTPQRQTRLSNAKPFGKIECRHAPKNRLLCLVAS